MTQIELWNLGLETIKNLETDIGILASSKNEAYGCVFGRDSLIVSLLLLRANKKKDDVNFLPLVKKILLHLSELQGKNFNIESGEEPGKIIHEFRREGHEHLTKAKIDPWYLYPDGAMRNYDSVDSTPLYLMALYEYLEISQDKEFFNTIENSMQTALEWLKHSTQNKFISYSFSPDRKFGGLRAQSWMDSSESVFFEESHNTPLYPISPLEVQAYAWAALRMWGEYFKDTDIKASEDLLNLAKKLKKEFNSHYVLKRGKSFTLAFAIDGNGYRLSSVRSSMGHVLWAAYRGESVLEDVYVPHIIERLLKSDIFVSSAGVRTLSSRSSGFIPNSYHNGSIWPHDTAILAQGLLNLGYTEKAKDVRAALIKSYIYFGTPIELFAFKNKAREYESASGHRACRVQAWSAAGLLATLSAIE